MLSCSVDVTKEETRGSTVRLCAAFTAKKESDKSFFVLFDFSQFFPFSFSFFAIVNYITYEILCIYAFLRLFCAPHPVGKLRRQMVLADAGVDFSNAALPRVPTRKNNRHEKI
jgi:hypothetical protein